MSTTDKFNFEFKPDIGNVSFTWNEESMCGSGKVITVETNVSKGKSSQTLEIIVICSEKSSKSTAVADYYRQTVHCKPDDLSCTDQMIHTSGGSNNPAELYFAIKGTLTIGEESFLVCLGQGGSGSTHNWHMCSMEIVASGNNKGGFIGEDYYLDPSGTHAFKILPGKDQIKIEDNRFVLSLSKGIITSMSYEVEEYKTPFKHDFEGVTCSYAKGKWTIHVKAGRYGSPKVASWFGKEVGKGKAISVKSFDTLPAKLNFAMKGTLTFSTSKETIIVRDFILAQGHNGFPSYANNWWLGGPKMKGVKTKVFGGGAAQLCTTSASKILPKFVAWVAVAYALDNNEMVMLFLKNPTP